MQNTPSDKVSEQECTGCENTCCADAEVVKRRGFSCVHCGVRKLSDKMCLCTTCWDQGTQREDGSPLLLEHYITCADCFLSKHLKLGHKQQCLVDHDNGYQLIKEMQETCVELKPLLERVIDSVQKREEQYHKMLKCIDLVTSPEVDLNVTNLHQAAVLLRQCTTIAQIDADLIDNFLEKGLSLDKCIDQRVLLKCSPTKKQQDETMWTDYIKRCRKCIAERSTERMDEESEKQSKVVRQAAESADPVLKVACAHAEEKIREWLRKKAIQKYSVDPKNRKETNGNVKKEEEALQKRGESVKVAQEPTVSDEAANIGEKFGKIDLQTKVSTTAVKEPRGTKYLKRVTTSPNTFWFAGPAFMDKLCLTLSNDMHMTGIELYGCWDDPCGAMCRIRIASEDCDFNFTYPLWKAEPENATRRFNFDKPIYLHANRPILLEMSVNQSTKMFHGVNGVEKFALTDNSKVTFTFTDHSEGRCVGRSHNTDNTRGQFPGFYFVMTH